MKRLFDIIVSLIALTIFLPFGIIIAVSILLSSKGGVFYRQQRIGKNGIPFSLWKFRTMKPDSDKFGQLTVGMNDIRITKIGGFLRRYKLDEFPQFINVFMGEMSVVGPRPEVEKYVNLYNDEQRKVLRVRPGITDYASLEYFKENEILGNADDPERTYIDEVMPAKLALNKKYLMNPGILRDFKIMWLTFLKMVKR